MFSINDHTSPDVSKTGNQSQPTEMFNGADQNASQEDPKMNFGSTDEITLQIKELNN